MATSTLMKILITLVLASCLTQGIHSQGTEEEAAAATTNANPCDPDPCGENEYCYEPEASEEEENPLAFVCIENGYRPGHCSLNAYLSCHEYAECIDSTDQQSFTCKCQDEAVGDGFKPEVEGTGCTLSFKPCSVDDDCPEYGHCDTSVFKCVCDEGFDGDGTTCTDIDECESGTDDCDENAICDNTPGAYTCTCNGQNDYVGDGFTCTLFCVNDNVCDVPRARCNDNNRCECIEGYEGDGTECTDFDECADDTTNDCHDNAKCVNTVGSYECECSNGYTGDGMQCEPLPSSCADIGSFVSGEKRMIDPDFTGPANAFEVECIYIKGIAATRLPPIGPFPLPAPTDNSPLDIEYNPEPSDIVPLLQGSSYCYQDISFACYPGYGMFPGTQYFDAFGNAHKNWGSTQDNMCACGTVNQCPTNCYCDGTQTAPITTDSGRIVDKSRLPVVSIMFRDNGGEEKGRVIIGPLICAPQPVDIPKDCHEAKFEYGITHNTPLYIDVDGPGGQDPFLVFCDMESFKHVGITEINPQNPNLTPTTIDGEPVTYNVDHPKISALIEGSVYCGQYVEFQCQNSKLGPDGGYISVTSSDRRLNYFAGADGVQDSCGCGATQSCDAPEVKCNCNIEDGQARKDFGLIINKEDLPVVGVTAEIGDTRSGSYTVGNLRCSQKQFGIAVNCEMYRATGVKEDYSYFIDPDGPGGLDPYLVECQFIQSPPQGNTIVHHEDEGPQTVTNPSDLIQYLLASPEQIDALKDRSTFCTQEISINCNQFNILSTQGSAIMIGATDQDRLNLADYLDTCGADGSQCNCNGAGQGSDSGVIADLAVLPINEFDFSGIIDQVNQGAGLQVSLGPLVCSEVFPTCAVLKDFIDSGASVEGEQTVVDGFFTIDPDGAGGVEPFEVRCTFPQTIVPITTPSDGISPDPEDGPVSQCFDIQYKSESGANISPAQISALVDASGKCRQELTLDCENAPASGHVSFSTCDGKTQPGWAGSFGADSCACGVNGNCDGGPETKCNCDVADSETRSDSGTIIDSDRLPVCQICLSIDPPTGSDGSPAPTAMLQYKLGQLKCDAGQGTKPTCQHARRAEGSSITEDTETYVAINSNPPYPVGCLFTAGPDMGIMLVKPHDPVKPPTGNDPTDVTVTYITLDITILRDVLQNNEYCTQNVFLFCASAESLQLGGNFGWYNFDGQISYDWTELAEESDEIQKACEDHIRLCQECGLPKGFQLNKKEDLPVARILLAGAGVTVVIDNVECLDLKKSCQDILNSGSYWKGFVGGKRYVIDVDGVDPVDPFTVNCEFDKENHNGVSEVPVTGEWVGKVVATNQKEPGGFSIPLEYDGATPGQLDALTQISDFCWQGVKYECRYSPLVGTVPPSSFYSTYNGGNSPSFGTAADSDFPGCACSQTGTCLPGFSCNCDAMTRMAVDQGAVTDKDNLPITNFYVGGQLGTMSVAQIGVTNLRCGSKPLDPPRDCAEALARGSKYGVDYAYSSEYLISPDPENVPPFMVRCDFDMSPDGGVTIVKPNFPTKKPLTPTPGQPTDVPYYGPTDDQLLALVGHSAYCYQGVKFDCYGSTLLSEGGYFLGPNSVTKRIFWGGGGPVTDGRGGVCACGASQACGGLDSASGQRNRRCNCDLGDNKYRSDAGIIGIKEALPLRKFLIGTHAQFQGANLTIGDLICSQTPLKFNECEMGFSDCDKRASCVDEENGYRCVCPPGWNGKGVVLTSQDPRANGRECIDDNECVANKPCPYSATCTNTDGDFYCTCKPGYTQTGKTSCQDINECAFDSLNDCDENARCENLDGSYRCICKRGFRGDGRTCIPVGECVCFGDPHCNTFDNRWLHFQGDCSYVLSQDGCKEGATRTFRITVEHWKKDNYRPGYYTWIKTVIVEIFGKVIRLEQEGKILVDGILYRQYYNQHLLSIINVNQRIQLKAVNGLQITWDGKDVVEVTVPRDAQDSTCGLCGDYDGNPGDDFEQGPACPGNEGQLTQNPYIFGRSWTVLDGICNVDCSAPPPATDEECFMPKAIVDRECDELMNPMSSPFKECLNLKSPEDLEAFRLSCVFDLCHEGESIDDGVCRFAEIMSWDCADNEKVEVKNWKDQVDACEKPTCPNNMIYKPCGPAIQATCMSQNIAQDNDYTVCNEGCFCADNQVMEGDKCILPAQCGCYYEDGYLATGDVVILPDCSSEIECYGSNNTQTRPVSCGENEECRTEDGVTGCYCEDGYIMQDGQCVVDDCHAVECSIDNMECQDGTCVCKMGFIGDCNQCKDIDECATGENDCNMIGQACLNIEGDFRCICKDGFLGNGDVCKDIDECDYGIDQCSENSECVNTLGGYLCECCAGYSKDAQGNCVRDEAAGPVAAKCCACSGENCEDSGKVCGTDGKTYSSYRSLSIASCRKEDPTLKVNYKGPCQGTCETVICDIQYATCNMDDGTPKCACPTCEDSTSETEDVTVCATNKITYTSICHMKAATCEAEIETTVEVETTGIPCPGDGPPVAGSWTQWGPCSEDCKQGVRTRTRPVYATGTGFDIHDTETVPCYNTCPQGPCTAEFCTGPAQVCVADENNAPSCDCPECHDNPEEPICGRVGNVVQTYPNECQLQAQACQQGEADYEVLEPRACEDKPVECGRIRSYRIPKDENDCVSLKAINFAECYGGCDEEAELCCYGTEKEMVSTTMQCPNGDTRLEFFEVITGCNCITKDEVDSLEMEVVK